MDCQVVPDGTAHDLTQGWLRASHRAVDPACSKPYHPYHPHTQVEPLVPGVVTSFEIGVLPTAQRFLEGHRLQLILTSDDTAPGFAMQGVVHAPLSLPAHNTIFNHSRLTIPVISGKVE